MERLSILQFSREIGFPIKYCSFTLVWSFPWPISNREFTYILARKVNPKKRNFRSVSEFKKCIQSSWERMDISLLVKLVKYLPKRCTDVLDRRKGSTDYYFVKKMSISSVNVYFLANDVRVSESWGASTSARGADRGAVDPLDSESVLWCNVEGLKFRVCSRVGLFGGVYGRGLLRKRSCSASDRW